MTEVGHEGEPAALRALLFKETQEIVGIAVGEKAAGETGGAQEHDVIGARAILSAILRSLRPTILRRPA